MKRAIDIFGMAVEFRDQARVICLDRACGDDAALRAEVESLLEAHEAAGVFLGEPTQDLDAIDPLLKGILDDTAQRLSQGEIKDELIAAELHQIIGVAYRDIGSWDEADQHIPAALEIHNRLLGEDDPATMQSVHEMIALHAFLSRWEKVDQLAVSNLDRRMRVLPTEHPDTLRSMQTRAVRLGQTGRLDEVEPILIKVLEIRTRVLGPEHRDTLETMGHLGLVYSHQGRLAEAESMLSESIETRKQVLGEAHPDLFPSMGNLAEVYEKQGRNEEAVSLATEVRDLMRRVLSDHPYTLLIMSQVVSLNGKLGRDDDVCEALAIEFSARRRAQGMLHPRTLRTMRDLGRAYENVGRDEDAVALYRESIANLPSTPDDAGVSRHVLFAMGWLLTRDIDELQEPCRAVGFAQRAVDVAQAETARDTYKMLDLLALAQHQCGDTAGAVETQKRAIDRVPPRLRAKYEAHLSTYQDALGE